MSTQTSRPAMKKAIKHKPLSYTDLRWQCDPATVGVRSTREVSVLDEIIGQERAVRSIKIGLEMRQPGYNVYVSGYSGTGRTSTVKRMLETHGKRTGSLYDHCLIHNFTDPDRPLAVSLPAGMGTKLQKDMDEFITDLQRDIPALFESQRFQLAKKSALQIFQERQRSVMENFERKVKQHGFEVVNVQIGNAIRPDIAPVIDGKPASLDEVDAAVKSGRLSTTQREEIIGQLNELQSDMSTAFRELRNIDRKTRESVRALEEQFLLPLIDEEIAAMKERYTHKKLHAYFDGMKESLRLDIDRFRKPQASEQQQEQEDDFIEFQVNVLVDNSQSSSVPIIFEKNPKYQNLFGSIDREQSTQGVWYTDHMHAKAGALLRADGGYLVLNALDVLMEPGVWNDLKRALRTRTYNIQPDMQMSFSSIFIKPEPFDLDIKVIMIGDPEIYQLLYFRDEDFKKIFKVRADFDNEIPKNKETIDHYVNFVAMVTRNEQFLPMEVSGLSQVIEFGVRLAGRKEKISTRFTTIADIVREAHYWAQQSGSRTVTARHVDKAIEEREFRLKLSEEKVQEMIINDSIMIATEGVAIGQVNGLSVYDFGEYAFGKPTRISAQTSMGRSGVINIEREAELSGPTHTKGIAILTGFLSGLFAQNKPLTMNASVAFEQSYGGVDGDSASSTEIYAILSSLSEVPIRQDIAVTGSVNQFGEIQPIGGVNLKIEGFFDVCKERGFTGTQGVLIPWQNIQDLMLREDVIEMVKKKKFHVYAVRTISEGIEILTGVRAGVKQKDGSFERGTLFEQVDNKLSRFARDWKQFQQ